ncbi:uncharacterized protein L969DRAFT_50809 [Mixia osmundae IAM 14324]|uniref:Uncharacterized protein n=1 Tax=Mixia osmundae (strain CBS 9802 / IAM 14324 / JCM 22182 / KY 12970) TaxID=764103 RepID=G7E7T5_MIXOS|nr:uncharacterized protein L969DRAFT_50809 [Mixia osmundae IAM 14324]KEI38496.1 hypothetical protein L969DRAFT_50809 [Mixia osmundae IAM 14324]GAA98895.1 hypothetical protein E5Q_05583 [Mixia osmundae IAM 14324]
MRQPPSLISRRPAPLRPQPSVALTNEPWHSMTESKQEVLYHLAIGRAAKIISKEHSYPLGVRLGELLAKERTAARRLQRRQKSSEDTAEDHLDMFLLRREVRVVRLQLDRVQSLVDRVSLPTDHFDKRAHARVSADPCAGCTCYLDAMTRTRCLEAAAAALDANRRFPSDVTLGGVS